MSHDPGHCNGDVMTKAGNNSNSRLSSLCCKKGATLAAILTVTEATPLEADVEDTDH